MGVLLTCYRSLSQPNGCFHHSERLLAAAFKFVSWDKDKKAIHTYMYTVQEGKAV